MPATDELTVAQAAKLLDVTTTWIYELVRDGKLTPIREERKSEKRVWRYFSREDVEKLKPEAEK